MKSSSSSSKRSNPLQPRRGLLAQQPPASPQSASSSAAARGPESALAERHLVASDPKGGRQSHLLSLRVRLGQSRSSRAPCAWTWR